MLTLDGDRFAQLVYDRKWWRRACVASFRFAPRCLFYSMVLVFCNIAVVFISDHFFESIRKLNGETITDLTGIMAMCLAALVGIGVTLVIALWSATAWLFKLTAFARALWEADWAQPADAASKEVFERQAVDAAVKETSQRRMYLVRLWFVASFYLIVPIFPLTVLIAVHCLLSEAHLDVKLLGLPAWIFSPPVVYGAFALGAILTVISMALTFVIIAFSAISQMPAGRTATIAVKECLKHLLPVCALAAIILVANIVVTAPQMILALTPLSTYVKSPTAEACAQIWLGITSPFLWPLSLAPFCRVTRLEAEPAPAPPSLKKDG